MSLWPALKRLLRPPRIDSGTGLAAFMETRAAYLVQKSIMEYVQARSTLMFSTLMKEKAFLAAFEQARWASYPAGYAMVAEMAEGRLRPVARGRAAAAIAAMGSRTFASFPIPEGEAPDHWNAAARTLERHLAASGLAPPKPVHLIPRDLAREVFDSLPVHRDLRRHDFEMFRNTLTLHLAEIAQEFDTRVELERLAATL